MTSTHDHDREECRRLAERVSEYLDGELPPEVAEKVREHFADCSNCETFLTSLQRVKNLGTLLPRDPLTPEQLRQLARAARKSLDP